MGRARLNGPLEKGRLVLRVLNPGDPPERFINDRLEAGFVRYRQRLDQRQRRDGMSVHGFPMGDPAAGPGFFIRARIIIRSGMVFCF